MHAWFSCTLLTAVTAASLVSPSTASAELGDGRLTVRVPPDAEVVVNGYHTASSGPLRRYVTRGLRYDASYEYEVQVSVLRNGRKISRSRSVAIRAGDNAQLTFDFQTPPVPEAVPPRVPPKVRTPLSSSDGAAAPAAKVNGELLPSSSAANEDAGESEETLQAVQLPTRRPAGKKTEKTTVPQDAGTGPLNSAGVVVDSKAFVGEPFGVGKIEFQFPETGPRWHPDLPLFLREASQRIRYPAFSVLRPVEDGDNPHVVRRVTVYFLFSSDKPLAATLASVGPAWASVEMKTQPDVDAHATLLREWWQLYTRESSNVSGPQRLVQDYLVAALGRRLNLDPPPGYFTRRSQTETTGLERQFESAVRLLFGIDSVLLAMRDEAVSGVSTGYEPADRPLPRPVAMPATPLPLHMNTSVEPLALRVPKECFYVRFQKLGNYQWLRQFVMGWGGNLREIVSTTTVDTGIRDRIQTQLGLHPEQSERLGIDDYVSDMALIGCDLFFRDGAAVGVLIEAHDSQGLSAVINEQRTHVLKANPDVTRDTRKINGQLVSFFWSSDNRVRSFYAVDGNYHLVTNTEYIVRRFLECRRDASSLGNLNEFRHARKNVPPSADHRVFFYLSDPFFRHLVGPHYRIEMSRRGRALTEIADLRMAGMVAASEGHPDLSVEDAKRTGLLPEGYGLRPDHSYPCTVDDRIVDSLRGSPGTLLPIPDLPIKRATRSEVAAYGKFANTYRQDWRAMDPVVATLSSSPTSDGERERISLQIRVTPYARSRYEFLTRHLAPASKTRCAWIDGDLLSLDARLRDNRGTQYALRIGLLDETVPFRIRNGRAELQGDFAGRLFGKANAYALITPAGQQELQLLNGFVRCVKAGSFASTPISVQRPRGLIQVLTDPVGFLAWWAQELYGDVDKGWFVLATRADVRRHVLSQTGIEESARASQARFHMVDPGDAAVAPYLHAFTYMESRRASAANAGLVNLLTQQLNLPPEQSRATVEALLNGRLVCPLQGQFRATESPLGIRYCSGTAWPKASFYDEVEMPANYRFPFLEWLHGLDAEFYLTRDTLAADVELLVRPAAEVSTGEDVLQTVSSPSP